MNNGINRNQDVLIFLSHNPIDYGNKIILGDVKKINNGYPTVNVLLSNSTNQEISILERHDPATNFIVVNCKKKGASGYLHRAVAESTIDASYHDLEREIIINLRE